ncbi:Glia maturation factor beta [Myotis brandtii]|uniref:Glia maturation factor beta n=1 Tax=Myotis brandtii TaxID=109478 RepID=S7N5N0_MYOBR|nr:Glia maturation factor beta [Myotis brandtii]
MTRTAPTQGIGTRRAFSPPACPSGPRFSAANSKEVLGPTLSSTRSESLVVCDVAEDLVEKLRKFRFRKETNNAAIIMKIDKDKRLVVLDEELEVFEIRNTEDLTEEWLREKLGFFH